MPVKVEFYCDACGVRTSCPPFSRNTPKHGHQVVCSERCRDDLLAKDSADDEQARAEMLYGAVAQNGGTSRDGQTRYGRPVVHQAPGPADVGGSTPTRSSFPSPNAFGENPRQFRASWPEVKR